MAYLVHHTLNRKATYTSGKRNPLPIHGKELSPWITRSTKRSQRLTNQHFFPFKTYGRKCNFECPIHGIINSGKVEGAYCSRVRSMFWAKTFFLKINFSNFERWIITCFIVALFRYFTIFYFLKSWHLPGWSVRTLDQYIKAGVDNSG